MSNLEKFQKALSETLDIEDFGEITDEMGPDEIESWDSLTHVELVSALEEQFEVNLDVVDISRMYTIGDVKKVLNKYGVEL